MAGCDDRGMDTRPLWDAVFAVVTGDEGSATHILALAERVAEELRTQAERAARECLSLPVHPSLSTADLERIVTAVNTLVKAGA